jgi:hypothetical protein
MSEGTPGETRTTRDALLTGVCAGATCGIIFSAAVPVGWLMSAGALVLGLFAAVGFARLLREV